jgi:hypothetical protein
MNDGTLAAWISTCHGEELYGELWRIDEQANRDITYAMLERNAERYHGTPVVFTGEVLEIQDVPESNAAYFRMALNDSYSRPVAVFALSPPPDEVVRGRRVRVYGTIGGAYSYQSQAGWDITIPKLNAVAVVLASMPRRPPRAVRPPAPEVPQIRMDPIAPRAAAVRDPEPVAEEPTVAETPAETPRPCSGHMCYRMDGTPTCVPARISCAAMHYTETPPGAPNTM